MYVLKLSFNQKGSTLFLFRMENKINRLITFFTFLLVLMYISATADVCECLRSPNERVQ